MNKILVVLCVLGIFSFAKAETEPNCAKAAIYAAAAFSEAASNSWEQMEVNGSFSVLVGQNYLATMTNATEWVMMNKQTSTKIETFAVSREDSHAHNIATVVIKVYQKAPLPTVFCELQSVTKLE